MDQSNSETVKTRILIISDTHNALPFDQNPNHTDEDQPRVPFTWPLPKADIVLHAGDLTINGQDYQHERAVELLRRIDAPLKIVIPGNHDLTLDRKYYSKNHRLHTYYPKYSPEKLDQIERLYTHATATDQTDQTDGQEIVYMVQGTRSFTVPSNGARFTLYANAHQPEFCNWAFGYPRHVDLFNPESADAVHPVPIQDLETPSTSTTSRSSTPAVDIMLTHGPPFGILDLVHPRNENVGCVHLRRAVERVKPRLSAFGHIHEAWGAVTKNWGHCNTNNTNGTAEGDGGSEYHHHPDPKECITQMGAYIDATTLQAGHETLFVNASIMDRSYKLRQAPWIVDLMLPISKPTT